MSDKLERIYRTMLCVVGETEDEQNWYVLLPGWNTKMLALLPKSYLTNEQNDEISVRETRIFGQVNLHARNLAELRVQPPFEIASAPDEESPLDPFRMERQTQRRRIAYRFQDEDSLLRELVSQKVLFALSRTEEGNLPSPYVVAEGIIDTVVNHLFDDPDDRKYAYDRKH